MRFSDNLSNIAAALAKVQAEIRNPFKSATNRGVQGAPKYATLEDTLSDFVRPICSKHGISIYQSVKNDDSGRVGVCTVLFHESGEFIESDYVFCEVIIPVSKEGKKILTEGQATGVCITYLRRYSLNAALGINGDADTDGSFTANEAADEAPLTYETALEYVIGFGKHSGKTLKDIYKADRDYISWLYSGEKTDPRIKEAIGIINAKIAECKQKKDVE